MPDHSSQGAESRHHVLRVACCVLRVACCVLRVACYFRLKNHPVSQRENCRYGCANLPNPPKDTQVCFKKKKMERLDPDFFAFNSCLGDLSADKNVEFAF